MAVCDPQDDGTVDKVPGSDFVVGRVAYRNSTSDYLIDGRKQKANEVVARLKQQGIDLNHNRFLILQVTFP
jgi:structural maintenance of chromosome 4